MDWDNIPDKAKPVQVRLKSLSSGSLWMRPPRGSRRPLQARGSDGAKLFERIEAADFSPGTVIAEVPE